jgi:bifunctional non-homologous end joining protein LigD
VEISNPDKVLFPADGITKSRMVGHYERVAPVMLAHIAHRPLTLDRYPNGIGEKGFFQKRAADHFPDWIERVILPSNKGPMRHPAVADEDGLAYLAGQGTVAFHIAGVTAPETGRLDRLVIDLDPSGDDVPGAREAARSTRHVLDSLGAEPGVMTTGSSGFHVVVRMHPTADSDRLAAAARGIAEMVARTDQGSTTEFLKADRKGRVFVDWLRNRPSQTSVAPWSLRPTQGAPVATPIGWEELGRTGPQRWRLDNLDPRLDRPDPLIATAVIDASALCEAVESAADHLGIDLHAPFDRFGRK